MAVELDGVAGYLQPHTIEWQDTEADVTHAGYAVRSSLLSCRLTFPDPANKDDVFPWLTYDDNQEHTVRLPTFNFPLDDDETDYTGCFVSVVEPSYQYKSLYGFEVIIRKIAVVDFYDGGDLLIDDDSAYLIDENLDILFGGWG